MAQDIEAMAMNAHLTSENLARQAVIQHVNDLNNGIVHMRGLQLLPTLNMHAIEHGFRLAMNANNLAAFCMQENSWSSIWFVRYGNDVFQVTLAHGRVADIERMFNSYN